MPCRVLPSHYKFTALVVVHTEKDSSFVVKVDFQSLHYFLVLELFPVFIHFQVHVVHIPLFEHQ